MSLQKLNVGKRRGSRMNLRREQLEVSRPERGAGLCKSNGKSGETKTGKYMHPLLGAELAGYFPTPWCVETHPQQLSSPPLLLID